MITKIIKALKDVYKRQIWKFPYLTGENGGGAFVFTYFLCVLLVGMPVMVSEFCIGRKTRKNAVGAFNQLKAKPFWKSIGFMLSLIHI